MHILTKVNIKYFNSEQNLEEKDQQLQLLKIDDTINFSNHFKTQIKRDELCLNFREKLIIAIKNAVFIFDSKNLTIIRIKDLKDDHKGGALIYVPFDNSVYSVSGLMSTLTEKFKLSKKMEFLPETQWEIVNKLHSPRAYYSNFVKNESVIYTMFGFNLWDNEYLSTIDCLDVKIKHPKWHSIELKGKDIPRLSFTACIPVTDEDIYIFGGRDVNDIDNTDILYFNAKTGLIENSKIEIIDQDTRTNEKISIKNLFYQESLFLPLRSADLDYELSIPVGQYDSKGILHVFNVKNFNYNFINVNDFVNADKSFVEDENSGEEEKEEEEEEEEEKEEEPKEKKKKKGEKKKEIGGKEKEKEKSGKENGGKGKEIGEGKEIQKE